MEDEVVLDLRGDRDVTLPDRDLPSDIMTHLEDEQKLPSIKKKEIPVKGNFFSDFSGLRQLL
jgi:hypothetical protein